MATLELSFAGGESSLSVRRFVAREGASELFEVVVDAVSTNSSLDIGAITGNGAALAVATGYHHAPEGGARSWTGICSRLTQVQAEATGVSTYRLTLVPRLWLATQRRGYRIFQQQSLVDIVTTLLGEWRVEHRWAIDSGQYPTLDLKVQYGETDYAFISRLLEEAGITFYFVAEGGASVLVLHDAPCSEAARGGEALPYTDHPNQAGEHEYVTRVQLEQAVRSGAYAIRDGEFRKPRFEVLAEAARAQGLEGGYEQFDYQPGAFLVEGHKAARTPVADDRGVARHSLEHGSGMAQRALDAVRTGNHHVSFDSNAVDLWPGRVFSMEHTRAELSPGVRLMTVSLSIEGSPNDEWVVGGKAVFADKPYRPSRRTPVPTVDSVQSATVVGPDGQEIHPDEYGRVRVQFPWEREGQSNEQSSCWLRVNQGWAGTGYGWLNLPRIGQEVLVAFMGGNPDRPVVVGRVFNQTNATVYTLPEKKKYSGWKSESSLGSAGYNEIRYEDEKGVELVYLQAQKNRRKLVKHDEIMTIGQDREKLVQQDEQDTTDGNRREVTNGNRRESTSGNRFISIFGNHEQTVNQDENVRTDGTVRLLVGGEQDLVVKQVKKDLVHRDGHLQVYGERRQRIDGSQSLIVGDNQQERIKGRLAVEAGHEIYLHSGLKMVIEGVEDVTFKAPGGYVRISDEGIIIDGKVVKINSGGSPGSGSGSSPATAEDGAEAPFEVPVREVEALLDQANTHWVEKQTFRDWKGFAATAHEVTAAAFDLVTEVLSEQGRSKKQIDELLGAGVDFEKYSFKKGDKLYGVISFDELTKSPGSMFWLNEGTYHALASKYDIGTREASVAIKNELALPCPNSASLVACREVTKDHEGLVSRVASQGEHVLVLDNQGLVEDSYQKMAGGGTQFTPSPDALGKVSVIGELP